MIYMLFYVMHIYILYDIHWYIIHINIFRQYYELMDVIFLLEQIKSIGR